MEDIIKRIVCAEAVEVIAVTLVKGNGTPEAPIDYTVQYYTKDGALIGEARPSQHPKLN